MHTYQKAGIFFLFTEYLIYAYILTMIVKQFYHYHKEKRNYFNKWWNIVLVFMLSGFLLAGFFWVVAKIAIGGWSAANLISSLDIAGHTILLLGNSSFSIASVISVMYLGSLAQVNSTFGPLQLSTLRMFKDIGKFLTIFLGVFVAFTLGIRNLYSYNNSLELEYLKGNRTDEETQDDLGTYVFYDFFFIIVFLGFSTPLCNEFGWG